MILDASARHVFHGCKRKYYWIYVEGLTTGRSDAMERGSVVHKVMEQYHRNGGDLEQALAVVPFRRPEGMLPQEEPKYRDLERAAKELVRGYIRNLTPGEFIVKEVEVPLAWYMGDEHYYVGEVDAFIDIPIISGQFYEYINEMKTTSMIAEDWVKKFQLDNQSVGYVFLARKNGRPTKGVLLNLLRATKYPDYVREPIPTPDWLVDEFESELRGDILDIKSRLDATRDLDYNEGPWPKTTDYCAAYNRVCEFHKLCTETPDNRKQMLAEGFYKKRDDKREFSILARVKEMQHPTHNG